jgi:release factor glutamine methyltransferase
LVAGESGLEALAAIVAGAGGHLLPGGWLLLEHGAGQGAAVRGMCTAARLSDVGTLRDLAGHERVTAGRRPAAAPRG